MHEALLTTSIPGGELVSRGKVRDIYAHDDALVLVATELVDFPEPYRSHPELAGRSVLAKRLQAVPVECVARGYISGSGWNEYSASGSVCGISLPSGLVESDRLPEPIFTPATKEAEGHDENINFDRMVGIVGGELAERLRYLTLELYRRAADYALDRGIIIADTKFEFGLTDDGVVVWMDEALTPDSSRFWPADQYRPGGAQPSFDKQFVRDWLVKSGWNKEPPAPALPPEVIHGTLERYSEAFRLLTGADIDFGDS